MSDDVSFDDIKGKVDKVINGKSVKKKEAETLDRVSFAHEIKKHPPEPGYMKVDVIPAIYSIDLNIDAHWWFTHVCTVFPLLLDQGKRTHIDIKDSFKPEKRLPDFNYTFLFIGIIGIIGIFVVTKFFGWW